jgi:NADPH2:quinone reductase
MKKAIVIAAAGGPEVLELRDTEVGVPGAGELRVRQTAVGVNFHDVYVRSGQYPNVLPFPGIPGIEACGVVEEVGSGVHGFAPGDRIAYASAAYGAYAAERLLQASLAVHVPAAIDDATAATLMVKGTTAAVLVLEVGAIRSGDLVLVHAAAGGVGRLVCQWARRLGATVIGTVGSEEKMDIARRAGCAHVIDYRRQNFVQAVDRISGGRGVRVVFDSVGKDTFVGSLACLARCGHLVNFGQSSGRVAPIALSDLGAKSATLTRPVVFDYMRDRAALESLTAKVFQAVAQGILEVDPPRKYPLGAAQAAHRDLEARVPMGAPVLVP